MDSVEPLGGVFGSVIKAWFAKNEWPQIVAEQVARAKGSKIGPWASQMSNCMQGKLTPKPSFFVALGWFNEVVTTRDFGGITDRRLMDRLLASEPLTHDDGTPYTATDFFSLYIGAIDAPKDLSLAKAAPTQDDVDQWARDLRELFRLTVIELMVPARDVWDLIENKYLSKDASQEDIDWCREVITGLHEPELEELIRLNLRYKNLPIAKAFLAICQSEETRAKAESFWNFVSNKSPYVATTPKTYPKVNVL